MLTLTPITINLNKFSPKTAHLLGHNLPNDIRYRALETFFNSQFCVAEFNEAIHRINQLLQKQSAIDNLNHHPVLTAFQVLLQQKKYWTDAFNQYCYCPYFKLQDINEDEFYIVGMQYSKELMTVVLHAKYAITKKCMTSWQHDVGLTELVSSFKEEYSATNDPKIKPFYHDWLEEYCSYLTGIQPNDDKRNETTGMAEVSKLSDANSTIKINININKQDQWQSYAAKLERDNKNLRQALAQSRQRVSELKQELKSCVFLSEEDVKALVNTMVLQLQTTPTETTRPSGSNYQARRLILQ